MAQSQCCYIGRGKIYVRRYVNTCCPPFEPNNNPYIFLGNVDNFEVSIDEEIITKQDFTNCAGGIECSASFINDVTVTLGQCCFSAANLASAFFGEDSAVASATAYTQTTATGTATSEAFIPLDFIPDKSNTPIVVTDGTTTYVEGVDYICTASGIEFTAQTTIPPNTPLDITYDYVDSQCIELLTGSSPEVEIFFDGINCADGERAFTVRLYKVRLNPVSSANFITEEFGNLEVNGTVTRDDCVVGTGFSQYGKIQFAG